MLLFAVTALRVTRDTSDWMMVAEAVEAEPAEEPPPDPPDTGVVQVIAEVVIPNWVSCIELIPLAE